MTATAPQVEDLGIKNEGNTLYLQGTLKDHAQVVVPAAALTSLKFWLTDEATGAIINTRNGTNILNTGNGTVDPTSGAWTLKLVSQDSPIVTLGTLYERHRILVEWTYNGAVDKGTWEGVVTIRNLSQI